MCVGALVLGRLQACLTAAKSARCYSLIIKGVSYDSPADFSGMANFFSRAVFPRPLNARTVNFWAPLRLAPYSRNPLYPKPSIP